MSARDEGDDFLRVGFRPPAFGDLPAAPEHDDPVRHFENVVHVVANKDHRPSAFGEAADELKNLSRLRDRERRRRLVHDDEPRIEVERARDRYRLTLSARKASDRRLRIRDVRFGEAAEARRPSASSPAA